MTRSGKKITAAFVLLLVLLAAGLPRAGGPASAVAAGAAGEESREYKLKAAFIYNFVQFVDWPASAFANAQSPIVITVVGENPFGGALEQATRGKVVRGREIAIAYARNASAAPPSQVLFIAPGAGGAPAQAVRDAAGQGRLTISDADDFVAAGGCVQFFTEDNKLRFWVNTAAVGRASLKVSAKLLQLARVYNEPANAGGSGRAD
jgi:hypothetical protein